MQADTLDLTDPPVPVDPEISVRKTFVLPRELWEWIADYRHEMRLASESEAARRLFEIAREAEERRMRGQTERSPTKPRSRRK